MSDIAENKASAAYRSSTAGVGRETSLQHPDRRPLTPYLPDDNINTLRKINEESMSGPYHLTPLAETRPGMVLSDVVRDGKGNVLLAQGIVLTESMLASLARHGIDLLPILQAVPAPAPVDPDAIQARLDHLFRKHDRDDLGDWATGILRRYVEDYRLQREVGA
jgi:hypothetical protein